MRMLIAKAIDLAKEINGRTLFRNVSFDIAEGERIALYGRNGTGKTTLLRGLLGHVAFDRGRVERRLPLESWGWMAQQADADRSMTTLDYVLSAKPELYALKKRMEALQQIMASPQREAGSPPPQTAETGGHRGTQAGERRAAETVRQRHADAEQQYDKEEKPYLAEAEHHRVAEAEKPCISEADRQRFAEAEKRLLAAAKQQRGTEAEMEYGAATPVPDADPEYALEAYMHVYERYMQMNGYEWEAETEQCLQRLKLAPQLWNVPFARLSGGQKTRAQLARLALGAPKFLLLDEPTNHLDRETLEWLERWVQHYRGTVLYVSHDRAFIDRTADAVLELTADGCRRYTGGYTDYRKQKDTERRTQEALYRKQEQEREKLLESIRRYQEWFHRAHRAAGQNDYYRSKAKKNISRYHAKSTALERLEKNRVPKPKDEPRLNMSLDSAEAGASTLLRLENVDFAHGGSPLLFRGFSLSVRRGDRLAVIGPNGAGKSTLLKLMVGELHPLRGAVRRNPQTSIGYFAQELESLRPEETILDSLLRLPDMTESHARTILGSFLFRRDEAFKAIGDLSMGEKCRVAFLRLYFGRANLLVLDEPTNYLDIDTREVVEDALREYPGALVLVTHDRYLVRNIADRLVVLGEGEPVVFPGTYDEYAESRGQWGVRSAQDGDMRREEERQRLELRLAQLIGAGVPELPEEQERIMEEIRRLRAEIAALDSGAGHSRRKR